MEPFDSDRYRMISPLGGGGMAEVFLAVATGAEGFQKPVAIKRMHPHLAQSEEVARMFLAEARLAMHLHHQNIVSVFDVGRTPEGLYLVMELVDGWDLGLVLGHEAKARQWMPEPLALYVATQLANGLQHAYRKTEDGRPIMAAHRDLTPSNVMVTVDGEVKIADFGIARLESGHTEPGTFKGKIPYSAPEVIRGQPANHLSDQFSLGVVLHRLTSGQYPYGYHDNAVVYSEALSRAGPPPCGELSAGCAAVIRRMLSLSPKDRYPNIEEAGLALGKLLAGWGAVAGAPQLARFLAGLSLPPPPSSKVPRELPPRSSGPKPAPADPPRSSGPKPAPGASTQPEVFESDWEPGGPQLDASGQLAGPAAVRVRTMLEGGRELEEEPLELDRKEPLRPAREDPSFQQWLPPPESPAAQAQPADPTPGYEPLPGSYGPKPKKPFPLLLVLLAVLLLGGGAAYLVTGPGALRRLLAQRLNVRPEQAVIVITSEPSGAQVRIGGQVVGTTPWSQDNLYPQGAELEVQVTLRGYKPWTGKLRGGESAVLAADLRR